MSGPQIKGIKSHEELLSHIGPNGRAFYGFSHAVVAGQAAQETEPDSKAAQEIAELWKWIKKRVDAVANRS